MVYTLRSANPFDCGKSGLDVTTEKCHSLANCLKALLLNGILSAIIDVGIPCLAKIVFII